MTPSEFYVDLCRRGVALKVADGRLRYRAPAGVLTDTDRRALKQNRDELIALVGQTCSACERPLLIAESRYRGLCLRCMEDEDYQVAIHTMGARHRAAKAG